MGSNDAEESANERPDKLSLHPLDPDEALAGFLEVDPDKVKEAEKRKRRDEERDEGEDEEGDEDDA